MTLLHIPNVFSSALCRKLIELHGTENRQSGFMWPAGDGTYGERIEPSLKDRRDHYVKDAEALKEINQALCQVVERAVSEDWLQVGTTIAERHLVARYDAPTGRFAPHEDNRFPGTRHRQVAVSIPLNGAFVGGFLYVDGKGASPAAGTAMVFPCSATHEVTPVTQGTRFVYLTFLYDEAGEAIRKSELAQLTMEKL